MIKDFFNGNVRLPVIFWIYGFLTFVVYLVLGQLLANSFFSLYNSPFGLVLLYIYILFPFFWFPAVFYAMWRSADKYQGWRGWAILAKVAVIIAAIDLIYYAYILLVNISKTTLTPEEVTANVQILNRSLPVKIDSDTEFTRASVEQKTLTYHYKLINQAITDLDVPRFTTLITEQLIKAGCAREDVLKLLGSGLDINYQYSDKNDKPITTVHLKQSDCKK